VPDDKELLNALRARSSEAFRELFERYSDRMYRLAVGMLDDDYEAEDVVQEAFMRFFEKIDTFEGRSAVGTWLYRTTYNLSIDRLRKRKKTLPITEEEENGSLPVPSNYFVWRNVPERYLDEAEVAEQLHSAITSLPAKLKAVFILREIEGLSTQESADILDISPSAAKVRLHRARLLLRERLANYFSEVVREREEIQ
jgi:RNA polymerase sigma-70 factor (ECF subfamily)